jgi:hypothetical protein
MKNSLLAAIIVAVLAPVARGASPWSFDVETGIAWSGYNIARIPGDGGTKVWLSDTFDLTPQGFYRLRVIYQANKKDTFEALYAPLTFTGSGTLPANVNFNGTMFPAGTEADARYTFNSYRLTWARSVYQDERFLLKLGATAKVRDALIRISGNGVTAEKSNVGLVPLLRVEASYAFSARTGALLLADALAAPQGRAEDVLLAVTLRASDALTLRTGYRFVEGGADNDEVYNFALVNYAIIGAEYRFH